MCPRQEGYLLISCSFSTTLLLPSLASVPLKAWEGVQRRATKFVLNDYSSEYRERLITLYGSTVYIGIAMGGPVL